ncbi:MAG TPA: hypothetical protein VNO51_17905 [Ilumatobacteraceae bacterium]|nr:hypothetical protein [Ilumatobacteraceae bacterium]
MHTYQPTTTLLRTWPQIGLRWMPTFLGFPIGGYIANLIVGRIDAVAPAVLGGAITGAILGLAQWLGMRRTGPPPTRWVVASAAGLAVGLAAGAAAVGYDTDTGALAVQGAVCGAAIGIGQAAVLHRHLGRVAWVWPALLAGLWALGWTTTASAGIDVESQYTVFGSSGALVVTAATSVLAIALASRPERGAR